MSDVMVKIYSIDQWVSAFMVKIEYESCYGIMYQYIICTWARSTEDIGAKEAFFLSVNE